MNVKKLAQKDAARWAAAEMFFGEGAGTRRKLLAAEIHEKQLQIPGYRPIFIKYYESQDFAKHAIKASKERARLDRSGFLKKHTKALLRGDRRNEIVGLVLVGTYIHHMGYDKILLDKAKREYRIAKLKVQNRRSILKYNRHAKNGDSNQ